MELNGNDLERANDAEEKKILEGIRTLLVRQLEQSNKWKDHSMRHLVLLTIDLSVELQSDTATLLDPTTVDADVGDEDLELVSEGEEEDEEEDEEDENVAEGGVDEDKNEE